MSRAIHARKPMNQPSLWDRLLSKKQSLLILCFVFVLITLLFQCGYDGNQSKPETIARNQNDDFKLYLKPPSTHKNNIVIKSVSQAGQENTVFNLLKKENGSFVEMGAFDGRTFSNTYWLESRHGWTGLLIEANPFLCPKIDMLGRKSWRLCACISQRRNISFYQGGALGGSEENFNQNMFKQLGKKPIKITVPCFKLQNILEFIQHKHVNYFSLDVEGAEIMVLESIKSALKTGAITVDVWTIEYRVWDGRKVVVKDSMQNLRNLRDYFKSVGGYVEHSHLSNDKYNKGEGLALDVVFVRTWVWCKNHKKLPDGSVC